MRLFRFLVLTLAMILVAQLAPAAYAAETAEAVVVAVVDHRDGYASVTMFCRGNASAGATATTVHCEVWDSGSTSISHFRIYPGSAGVCYFKSNQMVMPIGYCARVAAQFPSGNHARAADCHAAGAAEAPPQPPPTTRRTVAECVEPVPLTV